MTGNEHPRAVVLVEPLQPCREIDRVAVYRVVHAFSRADVAGKHRQLTQEVLYRLKKQELDQHLATSQPSADNHGENDNSENPT